MRSPSILAAVLTASALAATASPPPDTGRVAFHPPPHGDALTVTLVEAPARDYSGATLREADVGFARLAEEHGLIYDPALAHAAREVAAFHRRHRSLAPSDVLWFYLDSAGAAVWGVKQSLISTNEIGDDPVSDALAQLADGGAGYRVGVGEAHSGGGRRRRSISVLAVEDGFTLERFARQPRAARVTLRGRLPAAASGLQVLLMTPDLELHTLAPVRDGRRFEVEVGPLPERGEIDVEVIADLPAGSLPMAQLRLHRGERLPTRLATRWPQDESEVADSASAEALAHSLLTADRVRFGRPALIRDRALDAVARAHSREMAERRSVGHVSPRTGTVSNRLRKAGYPTVNHAENLAQHVSVWEAEAGLFRSLGHRRNILAGDVTHVGIGAVRAERAGDEREWYLTQVFAQAVTMIEETDAASGALQRIDRRRRERGLTALRRHPDLDALAAQGALQVDPEPQAMIDAAAAARVARGAVFVAIQRLWSLEQLDVPKEALDPRLGRIGIGVVQHDLLDAPTITLVLLFAQ